MNGDTLLIFGLTSPLSSTWPLSDSDLTRTTYYNSNPISQSDYFLPVFLWLHQYCWENRYALTSFQLRDIFLTIWGISFLPGNYSTSCWKRLDVIKIVSIRSHTECVAEVCTMSLSCFVSPCGRTAPSEMSMCSDRMRKSWCPGGCEERPMSHCQWKAGRNICEVPSCLLLTIVYAVSSVKKGLVKIV